MEEFPRSLPNKKWWVFFKKTDWHRHWWLHMIPGYEMPFQHVYAACEVTNNVVMYLDPQMNGVAISLMVGRPTKHIKKVLKEGGKALYVERADWHRVMKDYRHIRRRGWTLTCASFIGYAMALDTGAVTPKGLYRTLVRDYGAMELEQV